MIAPGKQTKYVMLSIRAREDCETYVIIQQVAPGQVEVFKYLELQFFALC